MRTEAAIREFLASRIAQNVSKETIIWYKCPGMPKETIWGIALVLPIVVLSFDILCGHQN